jgi:hypothetical protein
MSIEQQKPSLRAMRTKEAPAALLEGAQLKQATNELMEETLDRILVNQNRVPTFFDSNLLELIRRLRQLDKRLSWEESVRRLGIEGETLAEPLRRLQRLLWRRSQGRFRRLPGSTCAHARWTTQ